MTGVERHKVIPTVYVVFERDNQVLLLKRAHTGYMDGMYSLPAGHLDGGEPAVVAAIREAEEETGLQIQASDMQLIHTMHRQVDVDDRYGHERIDMFFKITNWTGEPRNAEPHKCDELRWADPTDLPQNMVPEVRYALGKIAAGEPYSDYNFPGLAV